VSVHVDGLYAAAVHHDLPAVPAGLRLSLRLRGIQRAATGKHYPGHRAGRILARISASGHLFSLG
jgi:hypothetical protein